MCTINSVGMTRLGTVRVSQFVLNFKFIFIKSFEEQNRTVHLVS